jgi:ABC-2 type transport system permease protein
VTSELYWLLLRLQVTRTRVAGLLALGIVGVVVGGAIGASTVLDATASGTRFLDTFGLSLLVPVATLVFASAALGDPSDDQTLVYLWLRPVPRWRIVAAAWASSATITWLVVVGPLMLAAAATRGGGDLVAGIAVSATVGIVTYSAMFVALGLRVKRSLVWGLLYVFIWEGFVATANLAAARLAVRSYTRSLLSEVTDVALRLADFTVVASLVVTLAVAAVAAWYATVRLTRQDVP